MSWLPDFAGSLQRSPDPLAAITRFSSFYTREALRLFIYLFTYDKGRLAPLTCHIVHQTLESLDDSINTK